MVKETDEMITIPNELEKYTITPPDCPVFDKDKPDYRCSVDYDKTNYRKNKANSEADKAPVSFDTIQKYIVEFLQLMGKKEEIVIVDGIDVLMTVNYELIRRQFELTKPSDIIWMRFTKDGYLGVVASSNDINFDYNTNSGKIIKSIGKEWNENRIIVVPIKGIRERSERLLIEKTLGNFLAYGKSVPILDFYSHNLGN